MPAASKLPLSTSVDANYVTRDNIVVPTVTLGRTATAVLANAQVEIDQRLRSTADSNVAITNMDAPASVSA